MPFQVRVIDTIAYESVGRRLLAVARGSTDAAIDLAIEAKERMSPRLRDLNPAYLVESWEDVLRRPETGRRGAKRLAFPCLAILCVVDYQRLWPSLSRKGEIAPKSDYFVVLGESQDPVLSVLLGPRSPLYETFLTGFHARAEPWPLAAPWQLFSLAQVEQLVTAIDWATSVVGQASAQGSVCQHAAALARRVLDTRGTSICLTAED